jgi:hypothetical protein
MRKDELEKWNTKVAALPATIRKFKVGSGCWEWLGGKDGKGYGISTNKGRTARAHRHLYGLLFGPVPKHLVLDHLCRNRICVNPTHLEVVTHKQNILRGLGVTAANARKTHCIHGHPLSGDNLYIRTRLGKPWRQCRACRPRYWKARNTKIREGLTMGRLFSLKGETYQVVGQSRMIYDKDCEGEPEWKITSRVQQVAIARYYKGISMQKPCWLSVQEVVAMLATPEPQITNTEV